MSTNISKYRLALTSKVFSAVLAAAVCAQAQVPVPGFSKVFVPDTIGPGSVSTLRFDVVNQGSGPVSDLAFTDNLPAGVVIANPSNGVSTCGGALTAPSGGGSITFSNGAVGAASSCTIFVDVTGTSVGTHTNTTGDLTSSAGNSGPATDDLTVATDRPGFSKSFAPSSVPLGGRSTLTFTIDNTSNQGAASSLTFTDNLPVGMVVAGPANTITTCTGGLVTAAPGSSTISYGPAFPGDASVAASSSCTISIDVIGGAVGLLGNTSGELSSTNVSGQVQSSGMASATLEVTAGQISLIKSFTDDPVPAGGTVNLEFTVTNFDRFSSATNITFTDDLNATLSGLTATGLPVSNVCGAGSQITGTTLLTLTGGNLGPGGSCVFSVGLQVPAAASIGAYPNTTSAITADIGGGGVTGNPAADLLFVAPAPTFSKEFTDDPVGAGATVTLRFSITNTSLDSDLSNIAFIDELTTFLPFPISATLPPAGFCGPSSSMFLVSIGTDMQALSITGGSLAPAGSAGDSCTFDVAIVVPAGVAAGTYTNTTSNITGDIDTCGDGCYEPVSGPPATDDLVVVAGPRIRKEFTDDPAQPGGTVTLEFTLEHDPFAPANATAIAFTDDLDTTLSGLVATGLPVNDVCGAGSQISGTSTLSFTGGSLAPGGSCTFAVTLQVPAVAPVGAHTNTTSNVTANVSGISTTENPASDDLMIAGLVLTKEFTDDPAFPGGATTLQFTIANISPVSDATAIFFQDDLDNVIPGLAAIGLPLTDLCGPGNGTLTGSAGNTLLTFSGGGLVAGASCTFSTTLQVPAGAASDSYNNTTTGFSAVIGGSPVPFPNAADALVVSGDRLSLAKAFTDDPVFPGDAATLQFTITNLDPTQSATGIAFTDDLDAALSGLAATGLPLSGVCGAGSQISGGGLLTFTGGVLAAGASCTFSVPVQVPSNAPAGAHTNVTSQATATIGGFPVTGDPAMDDLLVNLFTFSKAFGGIVTAGGTTTLTFTIENLDASAGAVGLAFTDDLDAVVPGMVAIGLPAADVCGAGSLLSGTSIISLTGGQLGPGASCIFAVDVRIPPATPAGTYVNTTSVLSEGGIPSAAPATGSIDVEAAPTAAAIPTMTSVGTLILIALFAAIAVWRLNWRA